MRVSRNELKAQLNLALEAAGIVDWEAASEQVLWLQQCGLQALPALVGSLACLERNDYAPATMVNDAGDGIRLDLQDNSTLAWGETATDLLAVAALESAAARVELLNCRHRLFILHSLSVCAARGLYCLAHWRSRSAPSAERLAVFSADQEYPHLLTWPVEGRRAGLTVGSLVLLASMEPDVLLRYRQGLVGELDSEPAATSPEAFRARVQQQLDQGIEVKPEWMQALSAAAQGMLVESTDLSRSRGAGPSG
jgi:hypothetical protein